MKILLKAVLSLFLIVIGVIAVFAQNKINSEPYKLTLPTEEKFTKATDLLSPWRSSGCNHNFEYREKDCYLVTATEYQNTSVVSLFNSDGTLWYQIQFNPQSSDYFKKGIKKEFSPFAYDGGYSWDFPQGAILRMTSESENWYEVEVNEQKQIKKYIRKNDPLWRRTTWSYWLYTGTNILIDTAISQLLDSPDGKVIEVGIEHSERYVKLLRIEGDWALVRMHINSKPDADGWVRWKNGRDLLVGCFLNKFKLPVVRKTE